MLFPMVGPWNGTRPWPTLIIPSDVMLGLSMMSILATCIVVIFLNSVAVNLKLKLVCNNFYQFGTYATFGRKVLFFLNLKLKLVCNNFYQFGTYATFENFCNINACDVKYSGLAFVRGTLFDPAFGGLSGRYSTGQRVTPFQVRLEPLREDLRT
jgi:hypothetical protein